MIHQLEGILLIRIKCNDVCDSYKAKSKTFVIGDDFRRVETSAKVEAVDNFSLILRNDHFWPS